MALTATIYNFDIELADMDRQVYETLSLRLAQHPSESDEYLVSRLLAYLIEYAEGIEFSGGVSDPDEPTISVRDLTRKIKTWIEIGTPDAARLHKAGKAANRVAVYTHKDPALLLKQLAGEKIFRAEELELYALDRALINGFVARLERRVAFSLSITDHELYLSFSAATAGSPKGGDDNLTSRVARLSLNP